MTQITAFLPVAELFERTIRALAKPDVTAVADMQQVLADCSLAQAPDSMEEFSRALTQKVALEKILEQTGRNLRLLRGKEEDFHYGRRRSRNS